MRRAMLAASVLVVLSVTSVIHAEQITSSNFQLGYGATGSSPVWTDTENASTNSPATQGAFTFQSAPPSGGENMSGYGPTFANMTLTDGNNTSKCALFGVDTTPYGLSLSITGSYNGGTPLNVNTSNPGYTLSLVIDNVSVYGLSLSPYATQSSWNWTETTPGHPGASPSVAVGSTTATPDFAVASNYTKVAWNPGGDAVSLTGLNDTLTRTFELAPVTGAYAAVDGIEIQGHVVLTYNTVPEPSTLMLLATGLIGLLCYAWRKRR